MTTLFDPPQTHELPVSKRGDLLINFRNRDPDNPEAFVDFPAGTLGVLTIETETPHVVTVTPSGHDCVVRVEASVCDLLKNGVLWSMRLRYPDPEFADTFLDQIVANGTVKRFDGKPVA